MRRTVIVTVLVGVAGSHTYSITCTIACERLPGHSRSEYVGMSCSTQTWKNESAGIKYFIFSSEKWYGHGRTSRTVSDGPDMGVFHGSNQERHPHAG